METIQNKSNIGNIIFYTILILLIMGSVGFTYWRIVIQKDYQIISEVFCDPAEEFCFYYEGVICDEGDIECEPEDAYDYKIISKKAANIYACEQTEEKIDCDEELSCLEDELNCSYTNCVEEELEEGEACSVVTVTEETEEIIEQTTDIQKEATTTEETTATTTETVI